MGAATIPTPGQHLIDESRTVLESTATLHGLDTSDPKVAAFIEQVTAVKAQQQAEIFWLRSLLHPKEP